MKIQKLWRYICWALMLIILVSPFVYWSTGIGQSAADLSANIGRQPDGAPLSSPKAEAWHSLSLMIRLERLLIYPLLLLAFQFSGNAVTLRQRLETKFYPRLAGRLAWLGKQFNRLSWLLPRDWRERLSRRNLLVSLMFILTLNLLLVLLYLPFNFYQSFILTHQFGLSTQAAVDWLGDWGKRVVLRLVEEGIIWTGFYGLVQLFPRRWPIPAGVLLILFSFTFTLLTPILITPLFYQVQVLEDLNLAHRISHLAEHAGLSIDELYVIEASAKTVEANAYVTGFGRAQRIYLYDTLLSNYTPDQVEVVLAHELGHWYYQHVLLGLLGLGAAGWLGLFGLRWLLKRIWPWLGLQGPADVAGLPYLLAVISLASTLALPIENGLSRYGERQADEFALTITGQASVFIDLFEQLAEQNLTVVDAPAWEKFIFDTHPSTAERIRSATMFLRTQPSDDVP
jgi:STE24 endopeptidase